MKIFILFLGCFLTGSSWGYAQNDTNSFRYDTLYRTTALPRTAVHTGTSKEVSAVPPTRTKRKGRWHLGGNFGMSFDNQTTIQVSPQISYSRNNYFSAGGGISYSHYHSSRGGNKYNLNYMGLNLFARATPLRYLAFQIQPELLQRWGKYNREETSGKLVPALLVGGGFSLPLGPGGIQLMFNYDVIQNKYSPYGNLYYTVGYGFAF